MSSPADMQGLLTALIEQVNAFAARLGKDPDEEVDCHFCSAKVPLWENLLVMQLTGVPAHVRCPEDALAERLARIGPEPGFPYEAFSRAVDGHLKGDPPTAAAGAFIARA